MYSNINMLIYLDTDRCFLRDTKVVLNRSPQHVTPRPPAPGVAFRTDGRRSGSYGPCKPGYAHTPPRPPICCSLRVGPCTALATLLRGRASGYELGGRECQCMAIGLGWCSATFTESLLPSRGKVLL